MWPFRRKKPRLADVVGESMRPLAEDFCSRHFSGAVWIKTFTLSADKLPVGAVELLTPDFEFGLFKAPIQSGGEGDYVIATHVGDDECTIVVDKVGRIVLRKVYWIADPTRVVLFESFGSFRDALTPNTS